MGGKPESTVMMYGVRLPAPNAAFLNAVLGHGADLDDGNRKAQGHPGVSILSAVLALAESESDVTGKDVITAMVAGYDVFIRVSMAINPGHLERGFHSTGTCGAIGAAASAAKILRLTDQQTYYAMSLAATQAGGLLMVTESGQMAKPINPAKAAYTGILSARLVQAGSIGPEDPFEGKKGYFKAFSETLNLVALKKDLGKVFEINSCYIKLYPSCRHTHGALDAALLLRKYVSSPGEVKQILLKLYPAAVKIAGCISQPCNTDEAKFSIAYAFAAAFVNGGFGLEDLNRPQNCSSEMKEISRKVKLFADPSLENREANIRGVEATMVLKDGRTFTERLSLPKGDPEVPVTEEDIRSKIKKCAERTFDKKKQGKLFDSIMRMDECDDIRKVISHFPVVCEE